MNETKNSVKTTDELIAETQAKLAKLQARKRKEEQQKRETVGREFLNVFKNVDLERCEDYMRWVMELAAVQYNYRRNNPSFVERNPMTYDDYNFEL